MREERSKHSRRRFVSAGIAGVAALWVPATARTAMASDFPRVDEGDATAKALAYVHDASTVGADVRGAATRICTTCRFYTREGDAWGPCTLFPVKAVSARGWCKGWVAKS